MKKTDSEEDFESSWRRKHVERKEEEESPSRGHLDQQESQICDQVITFPCSICKQEIDLPGFFLHKKQHGALDTMGLKLKDGIKPAHSMIAVKRKFLITNLLLSSTFTENDLQSMNNALELLSEKQIPAYYKITDSIPNSSIYSQKISHLLIKGLAICNDRNSAWKADMNDKFTVVDNFGSKPNVCFFGLFDGHHGASAADFTSRELPVLLLHQLSSFDRSYQMTPEERELISSFCTVFREEYTAIEDFFSAKKQTKESRCEHENIHKAFAKAFWRMDRLLRLGRKEVSRVRWSGCSAVTCLLEGKVKSTHVRRKTKTSDHDDWAERTYSQRMPQILSGELHIAYAGNVQAVLCRNGKGFCLTKEHTVGNIKERRRVLKNGAIISSNEPHGLLEGQVKTTRGLGFHGNHKLKKFFIPVPQTMSVPIDDLCQFLILATNGLWEVLDRKEVTALAITMFQVYKETYRFNIKRKSPYKDHLFFPIYDQSVTKTESNTHILFQRKSEECVSSTNSKENLSGSKYSKYFTWSPKNTQTFLPEMTNFGTYSEKEKTHKSFYEAAAEYISKELVNAALVAGSRDNITVMVILLKGSEYQFLR